jgi:formylglycine-generating enzyme required for sulfatase activity
MGATAGEDPQDGETPQFKVEVEPFWMGVYEVTWEQYKPFIGNYHVVKEGKVPPVPSGREADAVSIPTPIWQQDAGPIYRAMGWEGTYPLADITQLSAKQYTKWLSRKTGKFFRLPTEAEWEYAARAGTTTPFFFGDDESKLGEYGWFFDNSKWDDPDRGHPDEEGLGYRQVGLKKPNPWGLYDIYGNVAEWVIDAYDKDHYKKFAGKTVSWREAVNWPVQEYPRVVRGGSWKAFDLDSRSASRLGSDAQWKHQDPQIPKSIWWHTDAFMVGFRVVRPVNEPDDAEKRKFWEADYDLAQELIAEDQRQARMLVEPESQE